MCVSTVSTAIILRHHNHHVIVIVIGRCPDIEEIRKECVLVLLHIPEGNKTKEIAD